MIHLILKILLLYICYKLIVDMNFEKDTKYYMFGIVSIIPVFIAFMFFNYHCLYSFEIIKQFAPYSLLAIGVLYTITSIMVRLLINFIANFAIKDIGMFNNKFSDLSIFFSIEYLLYSIIPIVISFLVNANFIGFIENTLITWGISILFLLVFRKIINKSLCQK